MPKRSRTSGRKSTKSYKRRKTSSKSRPAITAGSVVVRRREYITDIVIPAAYTGQWLTGQWFLNPGLPETFAWLARVGSNYTEYTWKKLKFVWKPMSADAVVASSVGIALGTVMMGAQYNPSEPIWTNKQEMENTMGTRSAKPSQKMSMNIKTYDGVMKKKLIRQNAVPTGQDVRFYDPGSFTFAIQGIK